MHIDVARLMELKNAGKSRVDYAPGEKLDRDAAIDIVCDVWIPAARSDILRADNVSRLKTKLIVSGANIPATAEAGASPLEPYNGATAIAKLETMSGARSCVPLNPYGMVGVATAFNRQPKFVAGAAANTEAGIQLVEKLSGMKALDLLDKESVPQLHAILKATPRF